MDRLSVNQIRKLKNLGNGSVKSVYDMENGYIIAIPRGLVDTNKRYDVRIQKHYHSVHQIYRTLEYIYSINERYSFYSMLIEFFLWEEIQVICKKFNLDSSIFLPVTSLYFNKNNVPFITRPKVETVGSFNKMIKEENKSKVEHTINVINQALKKKFNIEIITRDIYHNKGNCGQLNGRFVIIDYGLCTGIDTPFD